jgi:hypothetical protein
MKPGTMLARRAISRPPKPMPRHPAAFAVAISGREIARFAGDLDVLIAKARLHREHRPTAPLTRQAVAH